VIAIQDCSDAPAGHIRPPSQSAIGDHCCAAISSKVAWSGSTHAERPAGEITHGRLPGRSACPPYAGVVSLQVVVNSRPGLNTVDCRLWTEDPSRCRIEGETRSYRVRLVSQTCSVCRVCRPQPVVVRFREVAELGGSVVGSPPGHLWVTLGQSAYRRLWLTMRWRRAGTTLLE